MSARGLSEERAAAAAVVPWNLVVWQAPGVVVGAQLAAANQGRWRQETEDQTEGAQHDGRRQLAPAVNPNMQNVFGVELEVEP